MSFAKGDHVVLTRTIGEVPVGAAGRVIRVDVPVFASTKYTVLLNDGGAVEDLKEDDLFLIEDD
jgi:hypothetical protein